MQHDWIKSTLGHGETMCSRCKVTNREAAAIGMDDCDAPPPEPANDMQKALEADGEKLRALTGEDHGPFEDHFDDENEYDEDEIEDDFDCGLMSNGQCTKAGSEECDWSCPNRESELFAGSAANLAKQK